jgi:CRP/FNR family transcriptional regulator
MRSEERIAAFLLDLIDQLHARGFYKKEIILRMTREEIGSLLPLNLETVSRTFSKFATDGILEVNHRQLHILDMNALRDKANPAV